MRTGARKVASGATEKTGFVGEMITS